MKSLLLQVLVWAVVFFALIKLYPILQKLWKK